MRDGDSPDRSETLKDLLSDPIVWLVMKSDRVTSEQLSKILKAASRKLQRDPDPARMHEGDRRADLYRPGVGIMLLNARNEVLVGRRNDLRDVAWQMPQGGIDEGENARQAVYRELREEIGSDAAVILAETEDWLYYDLPTDLARTAWNGRWLGQRQKWFVMRFKGRDADITVDTERPEFSEWKWVRIDDLDGLAVSFKRNVYLSLAAEVEGVIAPRPESPPP